MLTRRDFLAAGAALAVPCAAAGSLALDSANVRYQRWIVQLNSDLSALTAHVKGPAAITEADIDKWCSTSIVPRSRAALLFSQWLTEFTANRAASLHASRNAQLGSVALHLFDSALPAGYGGRFPELPGSRFASDRYSVWYMHISKGAQLQSYFDDKERFPCYQLPPDGKLLRNAYPFLLFDDGSDALQLAGVGAEWMGAVIQLYNAQFF